MAPTPVYSIASGVWRKVGGDCRRCIDKLPLIESTRGHFYRGVQMTLHPSFRPRRLRRLPFFRDMTAEVRLGLDSLIQGAFVVPGSGIRREVASMPGIYQMSVDRM